MTKEFEKLIDCNHYHPGGFVGFCTTFNRSSLICDYNTIQQRMKCMYNHNKLKHAIIAPPKEGTTKMTPHIPNPTTSKRLPLVFNPLLKDDMNSPQTTTPQQSTNSHLAKIHAKKILVRGEPRFEITGFENIIDYEDLPREYVAAKPHFYMDELTLKIRGIRLVQNCSKHSQMSKESFEEMIQVMKECGTRLTKINAQIKERAKKFDGSEITITI